MNRWAVIRFPGSNCDEDALKALRQNTGREVTYHWHEESVPPNTYSVVVIPGGFSFGDYLRTGAIAKLSPAIRSLPEAVSAGAHVIGICNGFQILLEARLLPGVLKVNHHLRFVSKTVECEVAQSVFPWFQAQDLGRKLEMPIAHGFGNFQSPKMDLQEATVALRYSENPNGSMESIAGVYRKHGAGSYFGLMPHPERASFLDLRLNDGSLLWKNAEALLP